MERLVYRNDRLHELIMLILGTSHFTSNPKSLKINVHDQTYTYHNGNKLQISLPLQNGC
jgi:hypothetical protein